MPRVYRPRYNAGMEATDLYSDAPAECRGCGLLVFEGAQLCVACRDEQEDRYDDDEPVDTVATATLELTASGRMRILPGLPVMTAAGVSLLRAVEDAVNAGCVRTYIAPFLMGERGFTRGEAAAGLAWAEASGLGMSDGFALFEIRQHLWGAVRHGRQAHGAARV